MKKRLISVILIIAVCLQCTSCVYVQDALYDMGINVDFEEAWEGVQEDWGKVSSQFSHKIRDTVNGAIDTLNQLFKSEELPDTAIVVNETEFYLDFPLEKAFLPSSEKTVFLMPLYGYGKVSAYRSADNSEVSLEEAGLAFDLTNSRGKFTLDKYGTICGRQGGMGYFTVTYTEDGEVKEKVENVAVFVADCSFDSSDNYYTFSEDEKQYITACLDLSYTLYKAQETSSMIEWERIDNILLNINNLSDNLAAVFKPGESIEEKRVKKIFSDFFKDYADEYLIESDVSACWNYLADAVHLLPDLLKVISSGSYPSDLEQAIDEAIKIYNGIKDFTESKAEIKRLSELLYTIYSDIDCLNALKSTDEGIECLRNLHTTYESLIEGVRSFRKITTSGFFDDLIENVKGAFKKSNGKLDKIKIAEESIKAGLNIFDAISYAAYDYSENIMYLEILLEGLKDYSRSLPSDDTSVDLEIDYIEELIDDYNHKYTEAIGNFLSNLAAQGAEFIAGMNPIYSAVSFIAGIAAQTSNVSDKEKAVILSLYASAAFHTLDPIHDLFINGDISGDYDDLRYSVSLYLNLLLEINDTLLDIDSGEDRTVLQNNKKYIEKTLSPYLSLEKLKLEP